MSNVFCEKSVHTITRANVQYYKTPFIHPKRTMREHDFIYLLSGEWMLGQNGKAYKLEKDTLLILFAGNTHYGIMPCKADTKTMYFHVSSEDGDIFSEDEDIPSSIETLSNVGSNPNIKALFENTVNAKISGEQRKADLYFELLLCELRNIKKSPAVFDLAQNIKTVIHRYPEKFFTNEELAEMMNVSKKSAEMKFKKAFGKTIHQYTLEFKIEEAMSYFDKFEEISVKAVAYSLGFYDEYHFSKQFVKYTGISPAAYKKKRRK